ncbi:hypothetical protein ACFLQ1_02540 [Candidatus Auribacterota bacterium]
MTIRFSLAVILFLFVFICVPVLVCFSDNTLPLEAEEAMTRGLAAAKINEWELAIKYFSQAQEIAPESPHVLLNLGLASDRWGTRDILAIAYYRAYLAALPQASNAAQVRSRIIELEVRVEAKVCNMIPKVKEMNLLLLKNNRLNIYRTIASAQFHLGDHETASKTARFIKDKNNRINDHDRYSQHIVSQKLKKGNIKGALNIAKRMYDENDDVRHYQYHSKSYAYKNISFAQLGKADLEGARKTTALIQNRGYRAEVQTRVAQELLKKGDIKEAVELLKTASFECSYGYYNEFRIYFNIADAQFKKDDKKGALKTVKQAKKQVESSTDKKGKASLLSEIAKYQVKAGNKKEAVKTIKQALAIECDDDFLRYLIVCVQAEVGDFKGAKKTASAISNPNNAASAFSQIAYEQIVSGDKPAALKSISKAKTIADSIKDYSSYSYSFIAVRQVMAGDIEGAKETTATKTTLEFDHILAKVQIAIARQKIMAGDLDAADSAISQAYTLLVGLQPKSQYLEYRMIAGLLFFRAKDIDKARQAISKALETAAQLSPDNPSKASRAYANIVDFYTMAGDIEGARQAIPKAVELADKLSQAGPGKADWIYYWIVRLKIIAKDIGDAPDYALKITDQYKNRKDVYERLHKAQIKVKDL